MSEVDYLPVRSDKRGAETQILKALQREKFVPVIPPDPEDEETVEIGTPLEIASEYDIPEKKTVESIPTTPVASVRGPSTHTSRTESRY